MYRTQPIEQQVQDVVIKFKSWCLKTKMKFLNTKTLIPLFAEFFELYIEEVIYEREASVITEIKERSLCKLFGEVMKIAELK